MKNKKAAMEMSVGTIVTIVLLMFVLVLGVVLIQRIFFGATESVDTINDQVKSEINNLFNTQKKDIIVSLGKRNIADVQRGTEGFGFVFGFFPDDPAELLDGRCGYKIEASDSGKYCSTLDDYSKAKVENWIDSGTENVPFDEIDGSSGYALISLSIPETVPTCSQKFSVEVHCEGDLAAKSFFQINVKKGLL